MGQKALLAVTISTLEYISADMLTRSMHEAFA